MPTTAPFTRWAAALQPQRPFLLPTTDSTETALGRPTPTLGFDGYAPTLSVTHSQPPRDGCLSGFYRSGTRIYHKPQCTQLKLHPQDRGVNKKEQVITPTGYNDVCLL